MRFGNDMTIAEMLVEQMKASEEFKRKSFGLPIGEGFREMVMECLAIDKVASTLSLEYVMSMLTADSLTKALNQSKSPGDLSREDPRVSEQAMKYLYWGIQIGRELERQKNVGLWQEAGA